jgi:hypothetical protein
MKKISILKQSSLMLPTNGRERKKKPAFVKLGRFIFHHRSVIESHRVTGGNRKAK